MAPKYTILKVLIQNLSKTSSANQGFTLLELIVGMLMMLIVSGLATSAFIGAGNTFNKDKKSIDSSQNLSAILEMIGNDIKQSGESINDASFPMVEFDTNTDSDAMPLSAKIIVRKAVAPSLTLCQTIAANAALPTTLVVADSSSGNANCQTLAMTTTPSPILPGALRIARNYRCQLDNPDPNYETATVDACAGTKPTPQSKDPEQVRAAISDGAGHVRTFTYSNDNIIAASSQYSITVGNDDAGVSSMLNDARNKAFAYNIGQPIYLIEERVYTLNNLGELKVKIDGKDPFILIKRIAKFSVSARLYQNTPTVLLSTKTIDTAPATSCVAGANTQFLSNSEYTCKFNANPTSSVAPAQNWKTLAGVRIELQGKYDGSGASATASTSDLSKLTAAAEYFPRNVLSK